MKETLVNKLAFAIIWFGVGATIAASIALSEADRKCDSKLDSFGVHKAAFKPSEKPTLP